MHHRAPPHHDATVDPFPVSCWTVDAGAGDAPSLSRSADPPPSRSPKPPPSPRPLSSSRRATFAPRRAAVRTRVLSLLYMARLLLPRSPSRSVLSLRRFSLFASASLSFYPVTSSRRGHGRDANLLLPSSRSPSSLFLPVRPPLASAVDAVFLSPPASLSPSLTALTLAPHSSLPPGPMWMAAIAALPRRGWSRPPLRLGVSLLPLDLSLSLTAHLFLSLALGPSSLSPTPSRRYHPFSSVEKT